mgnify:CR=1 FL=1
MNEQSYALLLLSNIRSDIKFHIRPEIRKMYIRPDIRNASGFMSRYPVFSRTGYPVFSLTGYPVFSRAGYPDLAIVSPDYIRPIPMNGGVIPNFYEAM